MTSFVLALAALLALVLSILLWPLLRTPPMDAARLRQKANLGIFRDQRRELERERREGLLAEADFEQAQQELQQRLLEEAGASCTALPQTTPARQSGRKTAIALLLALPLASAAGYLALGTPQAMVSPETRARLDEQQIAVMVDQLAARLKANPDDKKGWVMLARSYKVLGRFADAAQAYGHAGDLLDDQPAWLADYAEVLVQANGGRFAGQPDELIARALARAPDEPQALFLAGASATERKDPAAVADYWGRLLPQLEPGSEEAKALAEAVQAAQAAARQKGAN